MAPPTSKLPRIYILPVTANAPPTSTLSLNTAAWAKSEVPSTSMVSNSVVPSNLAYPSTSKSGSLVVPPVWPNNTSRVSEIAITSEPPSCRFNPLFPLIVIAPADVLKLEAAPASNEIPEVESIVIAPLASISNVEVSISNATSAVVPIETEVAESIVSAPLASISNVVESISIGLSALVPMLIPVSLSILTVPPVASISTIPAFISSVAPAVVISISLPLPSILTPPAPSSVNAPAVVVKLEAAPASNEIALLESIVVVVLSTSKLPSIFVVEAMFTEPVTSSPACASTLLVKSATPLTANVLPSVVAPSVCNTPAVEIDVPVLPYPPPTSKLEPSNVKLASSSSSPLVPAITTLLSVKSPIAAVSADNVSIFAVPSIYKSFHSCDALPKSNASSLFGVREELMSAPTTRLSPLVSPSWIVPLVPASNVIFPTACISPPTHKSLDAETIPVTSNVPATSRFAIFPVKSKLVFPLESNLYKILSSVS